MTFLGGYQSLIDRRVPALVSDQIASFSPETLRARAVRRFDPRITHEVLTSDTSNEVVAIDIGGDKLMVATYRVRNGRLGVDRDAAVHQRQGGQGYVSYLSSLAAQTTAPVGISFAGPTDGTRLLGAPNLPIMFNDLARAYAGDFANLFSSVALANDAEAGIMAASVEAVRRHPATCDVVYLINGSGLGGAVLTDGTIVASEPGHIEVDPRLNPFRVAKPCGLLGSTYVCVEDVAASKAGIECTWSRRREESVDGRTIAARYLAGDPFATDLYDNSALVTAHVVAGLVSAFRLRPARTTVVAHGGIFQVPGYGERVCSILTGNGLSLRLLFTKDFSVNACLDGAAIAAVLRKEREPSSAGPAPSSCGTPTA